MDNEIKQKVETDFDRLLKKIQTDFSVTHTVFKGGERMQLDINDDGKHIELYRNGTWSFQ